MTQQNLDSALEQEIPVSTSSVTLLSEWRSKGHIDIDTSNEAEPSGLATSESSKWTARWSAHWRHLGWRLGVLSAFYISVFVLVVNISLLIVGGVKHGGYTDGIGTLNYGDSGPMKKLGLTYHVLINILSTALLTSSNYCMQILSAPSREELDLAHARNTWLDIGIISFRNLAFINRRRVTFWCILGLSSLPLHLLYNSAVFGVTTGQDYNIYFIDASDVSAVNALAFNRTNLTNYEWKSLYDTQYVPNAGDLYLIIDEFGLGVKLDPSSSSPSWSYLLTTEFQASIDSFIPGPIRANDSEISVDVTLNAEFMTYSTKQPSSILTFNVEAYNGSKMPEFTWPDHVSIGASTDHTWKTGFSVDHQGWLSTASPRNRTQTLGNTALHVSYGLSTHVAQSSAIQIARVFIVIVIICNLLKTVAIFFTLRDGSSQQMLTLGDAVSSYLKSPEVSTLGACIFGKKKLVKNISNGEKHEPAQWRRHRVHYLLGVVSNGWITYSILFLAGTTCILSLAFVFPADQTPKNHPNWTKWGTSSPYQLAIASGSFDSKTILLNAWLANTPQILLSFSYFAINRLCTSMCFAREWNSYGTARKGLRATNPTGQQRSTYFLQLPYRWSIPLTVTSGILHWLLSQSLFLVRLEIRDIDGQIITSESRCNCGYSPISILTFCFVFLALLLVILGLLLRKISLDIPAPAHCSLAISAACYPPVDDVHPHLKPVGWGVVRTRFGGEIAHCSFTSEEVTAPVEGQWYS